MNTEPTECTVRSADGTEIGVAKLGSGPAVVLVHGAWVTGDEWQAVGKVLAERHACHLIDRRGRGRSGDGADYSLDREIEDIAAVLDAAGPGASLLGHSSGAIYAAEVACRVPVKRLVLYEPPLHFRGQEAEDWVARFRATVEAGRPEEAATRFFAEEARLPQEELSFLQSTPLWSQMVERAATCAREWEAILAADLDIERYRDLSVPTLLLAGTVTEDHPSFATRALEETLPDVRKVMLEGQGHMAHQAVPDVVAREVADFLGATAP